MKFRKKSVVIDAITFDQLVQHGRDNGANIVGGMPWSFSYKGHAITHENDQCCIIPTLEGSRRFTPAHMLITGVAGEIYPCEKGIFDLTYDVIEDGASTEQQNQAKGLTAPRITTAEIFANIASTHYFTAAQGAYAALRESDHTEAEDSAIRGPLQLLTFCVLVLRNGFTVTGESACASPENFDADIGRQIARKNAVDKIWPLMGYELRTKLANS